MAREQEAVVRFRVLGATELISNGSSDGIGSERQRRLLAALAMRSPATVPTDSLVDIVWGADQPDNAVGALRTVVTRLRHSLDDHEPGSGQRIVSRPPGYVLDVPGDAIDANRFADLTTVGRRQLAEGELDTARRTLDEALSLWVGAPYGEFGDEPWAQSEATRLERLRAAAREAEIETRLASGLHAEALGDIHALVDDEPLSDGPRSLLIRALFASGRQGEALRAFQAYRALLGEELGLEPGQDLVRLEQRVLAGDPDLIPPSGRPLRGYRLHERLATTDRGTVFRASQAGLDRDITIEVIDEQVAGDAAFVRSFELQGQALAELGHAHVAPVYDCWRDPDGAYLVSRLLNGGSLASADVRSRLGREGLERVRDQVRSALDVAHQAGLVHGTIEPDDIQLDDQGNAYLANFRLGAGDATVEADDRSFQALFDGLVGPTKAPESPTRARVGNPYRGLAAFRASDVDVFFGRGRLVKETLRTLDHRGAALIVGPSGCGKSSLAHAGVGPALDAGELPGAERWFVLTMVPGADPFAELRAAVLRVAVHPPSDLLEDLRDPAQSLTRTIQRVLPEPGATAVIVVDQFEEVFTRTPPEDRNLFLASLAEAVGAGNGSLKLLGTLRADYYDQPLAHPAIASLVKRATVAVDALSGDELRAAIVGPAGVVDVAVEPDLVGRLVADASGGVGRLPLLQYTLTRVFERRERDVLTLDAYEEIGGLAGAIGTRAEEVHEGLSPSQRTACRRLFGRLVTDDETADTCRRARLTELRAVEEEIGDLDIIADRFIQERLLSTDRDPTSREPTLAVAHEALFREWPRLAEWIREDRATIATLRHLTNSTESWRNSGDDSELYRGARLAGALDLLAAHADRLTADERAFVTASSELAEVQQRAQRRTNRRLRVALAGVGIVALLAVLAGLAAAREERQADEARSVAETERAVAVAAREETEAATVVVKASALRGQVFGLQDTNPRVATLLALEANRLDEGAASLDALGRALLTAPGWVGSLPGHWIDVSPLGVVTWEEDAIILRSADLAEIDRIEIPSERDRVPTVPVISPGGDRVAQLLDGRIRIIDLATGEVGDAATETGAVHHGEPTVSWVLTWTADGRHVLINDDPIGVYRVDGLAIALVNRIPVPTSPDRDRGGTDATGSVWVAAHPNDEIVAVGGGDALELWDGSTIGAGPAEAVWRGSAFGAAVVRWGRDGALYTNLERIARAGKEWQSSRLLLDEAPSAQWVEPLADGALFVGGGTRSVLLDPDSGEVVGGPWPTGGGFATQPVELGQGDVVAVVTALGAGSGSRINLWSRHGGNVLSRPLPGIPGVTSASAVQYFADAEIVVVTDDLEERRVGIWDVSGGTVREVPLEAVTEAERVTISLTDGGAIAVAIGANGQRITMHALPSGEMVAGPYDLSVPGRAVREVHVSGDQRTLYVHTNEPQTIRRFDRTTGEVLGETEPGGPGGWWVVIQEEYRRAYVAGLGGTQVFDLETLDPVGDILPASFSAQSLPTESGDQVVVPGPGSIRIVDVATGAEITAISGTEGLAGLVDPSETILIGWGGGNFDQGVRFWDIPSGHALGPSVPGNVGWLHTGSEVTQVRSGRAHVWTVDTSTWPDIACEVVGSNLTIDEWEEHVPDGEPYHATCAAYPAGS
jgi:DNA-binding SARP family transcriptional activator